MKKIVITLFVSATLLLGSCADRLDTVPTHATNPEVVFSSVESSATALNGIYRYMQKEGYTEAYQHENFGQSSVFLAHDIAADDMIRRDQGGAWFFYDYAFWVRAEIASKNDRPYAWWAFYYKIIMSANNIIAYLPPLDGDSDLKNYILGQAYALRAFAYYYLVNIYQLTYSGNENAKGVPIYTEPTTKKSKGKGRGTVAQVYTQINSDLDQAEKCLKATNMPQEHISHIDLYTTYGLKARIALMQHDYDAAAKNANEALKKPGLSLMSQADLEKGFNSADNREWIWGYETLETQVAGVFSFMYHMDPRMGGYAANAGQMVSNWLYDNMDDKDLRKEKWFNPPTTKVTQEMMDKYKTDNPARALYLWEKDQNNDYGVDNTKGFPYAKNSYLQQKFRNKTKGKIANDILYMRAAEMYLIIAEASCLKASPDYNAAVEALNKIMENKLAGYDAGAFPKSNTRTFDSYADAATFAARNIIDEVYFQRRVELWGEGFRTLDLSRQKIGITREYPGANGTGNPTMYNPDDPDPRRRINLCYNFTYDEGKWEYTMMIPYVEIVNNPEFGKDDQNP